MTYTYGRKPASTTDIQLRQPCYMVICKDNHFKRKTADGLLFFTILNETNKTCTPCYITFNF